jgi:hypothetical protein
MPPVQKEKERILSDQIGASMHFLTRSLDIGYPADLNTKLRTETDKFLVINTGGSGQFRLGTGEKSSEILFSTSADLPNRIYLKPANADYYRQYWGYFNVEGPGGKQAEMKIDLRYGVKINNDSELRNVIDLTTAGNNIWIEGQSVHQLRITIDGDTPTLYYKPNVNKDWVRAKTGQFTFLADEAVSVSEEGFQPRTGSIFNHVNLFPNPAIEGHPIKLEFDLLGDHPVSIRVYNVLGHEVMPIQQVQGEGPKQVELDVTTLPPGVYSVFMHDDHGHTLSVPLIIE